MGHGVLGRFVIAGNRAAPIWSYTSLGFPREAPIEAEWIIPTVSGCCPRSLGTVLNEQL